MVCVGTWRSLPEAGVVNVRLLCLKCFPLVSGEQATQAQQHAAIGFFQFRSCLGHAIDLRQNFTLVRLIRCQQRLHPGLFFSHRGAEIHQTGTALLKHRFHFLLLVGRKSQFLR